MHSIHRLPRRWALLESIRLAVSPTKILPSVFIVPSAMCLGGLSVGPGQEIMLADISPIYHVRLGGSQNLGHLVWLQTHEDAVGDEKGVLGALNVYCVLHLSYCTAQTTASDDV